MAFSHGPCYAFSMQITIEIPDEFAAEVKSRGLSPESYVRSLIEDAIRISPAPSGPASQKMDIETFLREMAAHSEKIPVLPDEAFTRESFYQDHD
jgi:hypothetical protein